MHALDCKAGPVNAWRGYRRFRGFARKEQLGNGLRIVRERCNDEYDHCSDPQANSTRLVCCWLLTRRPRFASMLRVARSEIEPQSKKQESSPEQVRAPSGKEGGCSYN